MSDFSTYISTSNTGIFDPYKHVNYTLNMVMGVDEFWQDFLYETGDTHATRRELIGYGTVKGLQVSIPPIDDNGPQIRVDPGLALNPRGQFIRVPATQCAYINRWLEASKNDIKNAFILSDPRPNPDPDPNVPTARRLAIYLVLCYRECLTDKLPLPGEPCRSEDDTLIASRVADDYVLELRLAPPDMTYELHIRRFVAWLKSIKVEVNPVEGAVLTTMTDFQTFIRTYPETDAYVALPSTAALLLKADSVQDYLREAFRIWTTELLPNLRENPADVVGKQASEECVLLATFHVPILGDEATKHFVVNDAFDIIQDESKRPYLVTLRVLQEELLYLRDAALNLKGDVTGPTAANTISALKGTPVHIDPATLHAGQVLTYKIENDVGVWGVADGGAGVPAAAVTAETAFGQASSVGDSTDYARADHTHGTPSDPIPPHKADPAGHALLGDVTGTVGDTLISMLQGQPVNAEAPTEGQVLTYRSLGNNEGGHWIAATPPPVTGGGTTINPATTVTAETAFGQPQNIGTSLNYARADHTHGTPPDPIPLHKSDPAAHTVAGDVTGPIGAVVVRQLNTVPLTFDPTALKGGQILSVDRGVSGNAKPKWVVIDLPVQPPPAPVSPVQVVAAGIVKGDGNVRNPVFDNIVAKAIGNGQLQVFFGSYKSPDVEPGQFQYIVKVLPLVMDTLMFEVNFDRFLDDSFLLQVNLKGNLVEEGVLQNAEFMIEVSRIDRNG